MHRGAIECAAWHGVVRGTTATAYAPAATVRRDQMAAFLTRVLMAGD